MMRRAAWIAGLTVHFTITPVVPRHILAALLVVTVGVGAALWVLAWTMAPPDSPVADTGRNARHRNP